MVKKMPCKPPTQLIQESVNRVLETAGLQHLETPASEFRENSVKFNTSMNRELRAKEGIFFTPKKARDILFEKLKELSVQPTSILEPSFGTGEFLFDARRLYPQATIVGVEKNKELYDSVKSTTFTRVCTDFLEYNVIGDKRFDLIIGNPPYFIFDTADMNKQEKKDFSQKYASSMTGRPNIYIAFLYKCLHEHLADDGYLAFIIPTSIYNCSYYQPMRNYIQAKTTIHHLENLNKPGFYETGQETTLIVLQKKKLNDNYIFRPASGTVYITPFYKELNELCKGATTLKALGLASKTGNVVWNQVKENLADTGTLLIYSSNIKNNTLELNNLQGSEKKQFVKDLKKETLSGPVILVERGYGNSFKFNTALVELKDFYAENHLNVIYPTNKESEKNLERVLKSFHDNRSMQFIEWLIGNGMLSSSELENILPIF